MPSTFRLVTPADRRKARLVTAEDLLITCRAAAKLALQGDSWTPEDRADCATALVTLVLERSALDAERTTGDIFPARLCGMDFLVKRAANWRSAKQAERDRDAIDAQSSGERQFAVIAQVSDETRSTPVAARRAALDILSDLGVISAQGSAHGYRGALDCPAPLWTLAYTAARAAAGLESAEVAAELELEPAAHRAQLSRAAKKLREGRAWNDYLTALSSLEGTGWIRPGEYTAPKDRGHGRKVPTAPTTCKRAPRRAVSTEPRAAWSRRRMVTVSASGTAWKVDPLKPTTRRRLEKAAAMRQERARAAASDPAALRAARLAAGLPAEVR